MKKIFSFLAAVLFAGSMMATPYTLTFNYFNNTGSDNGNAETTLAGLFDEASMAYVDAEAPFTIDKVYLGRKYKDQATGDSIFSNIKFGTSKAAGTLKFALKNMSVDSVIVRAAMYGDSEGGDGFSVNGTPFTLSAGNKVFENVKYVPAGDITALEIVQTKAAKGRFYITAITVYPKESGVTPPATLTEPAAAPADPTVPANQVKAVYSETYNADCGFGEWGSGTTCTPDAYGKKFVTTNLGYFGLEFAEHLNCAKMEKLHLDVWVAADASIRIVPIWGGAEQGIVKNLVGQEWNSVEIALTEFDQITNWADVWQIKIDNAANLTFWLNNIYFYTTQAPAADTEAPHDVTASLVSASYFSAKLTATATDNSDAVIFVVKDGENELATAPAVSGVAKEFVVNGLLPNTAYNLSVIAKDEAGNAAAPVNVAVQTLAAPAPATAPTYAADKVLGIQTDAYTDLAYGIQDWYSMPAITLGNLTATSKAFCIDPTGTPNDACFGMAFAPTDITAYDALEMDVYPTVEGAKLKIQVIGDNAGLPAATEYELVANQWNHISLDIKGNTKTNCEQVGFYDCNNLLGACFVQNVLFVDTDEDITPEPQVYNVAEAIAAGFANDDEISVRGVITKMEFKGKNFAKYGSVNIYVADVTGAEGEFEFFNCYSLEADTFRASVPEYDAASNAWEKFTEVTDGNGVTVHVGDTIVAFGKYKLFNTTHELNTGCYITELKPAATAAQDINVTLSSITTPGALIWADATATDGWWQIMGESDSYVFSLSNAGEIAQAAGTYTVADLDPDFSSITLYGATDTVDVAFVDGSVTVAISEEGIVTVNGTLVGADGNNYIFNLTYKDPTAEKTVELNIPAAKLYDEYAASGLYGVYGTAADNVSYVQLAIWTETEFAGDFTDDDLDFKYIGSGLIDADGTQSIFSANITVTPGATKNDYSITADLLCYNNTLYKVTMTIGAGAQGIEEVDAAVKAIKSIVNGQLIIEKKGVKYNAQGAVIRK